VKKVVDKKRDHICVISPGAVGVPANSVFNPEYFALAGRRKQAYARVLLLVIY
jgi:hypothetical protein